MLGPRIAMLRKQNGYSQAELAARLQISSSSVGMYEQGRREPSAALLVAIAREFHVSIDYLLTGQPGKNTDFLLMPLFLWRMSSSVCITKNIMERLLLMTQLKKQLMHIMMCTA